MNQELGKHTIQCFRRHHTIHVFSMWHVRGRASGQSFLIHTCFRLLLKESTLIFGDSSVLNKKTTSVLLSIIIWLTYFITNGMQLFWHNNIKIPYSFIRLCEYSQRIDQKLTMIENNNNLVIFYIFYLFFYIIASI